MSYQRMAVGTAPLTLLVSSLLFVGLQAQGPVLAWDHVGGATTFRIETDAAVVVSVPVPTGSRGLYYWTVPEFALPAKSFLVSACNNVGLCSAQQSVSLPDPVPPPVTNLAAQTKTGILGTGLPSGTFLEEPGTEPPDTPSSPFPTDGSASVSVTPTLTFVSNGATDYAVYFGTVNPPTSKTPLGATASFTPPALLQSTTYYWQGEGCNTVGMLIPVVQCTLGPIWSLTTVVPTPPPSNLLYLNPTNGQTGVWINPTLTCIANDATTYAIRFGTVNPPVTETSLGGTCSHAPATLAYETTYYWRILATNVSGTTTGSVVSFTTIPEPVIPDPDPGCASKTVSATGYNHLLWTPCRQDAMDVMEANYLAHDGVGDPADCSTNCNYGGKLFQEMKNSVELSSYNHGRYAAFMYAATGDATYATRALYHLNIALGAQIATACPAPNTDIYQNINRNSVREYAARWVIIADVIKPGITGGEHATLLTQLAAWIDSSWRYECKTAAQRSMNLGDSDQTTGEYFSVALLALRNPSCALCQTLYQHNQMGGLTPTKTVAEIVTDGFGTARNAVFGYVSFLAESGEWIESAHYNRGTVNFMVEGYEAMKTMLGEDLFPEITAWLPVHSVYVRSTVMPDLVKITQHGDIETSQVQVIDKARYMLTLGNLAGLLKGTTEGRKANRMIYDFVAQYGATGYQAFVWGGGTWNPMMLYDPNDSQVEWRDTTNGFFEHNRLGYRKSDQSSSSAAYFHAYFGGLARRFYSPAGKNGPTVHHSEGSYNWGAWELYQNEKWQVAYNKDFTVSHTGGDGSTGPIVHGWASLDEFSKLWSNNSADLFYMAGTNGGAKNSGLAYCGSGNLPQVYLHENTAELVNLPGATTQIVVAYHRINADPVVPTRTCYTASTLTRMDLFDAFHHKLLINHAYNSPSQVGNAFSWLSETSVPVKMSVGFPSAITATIVNEKTTTHWSAWSATLKAHAQARFHIRVAPNDGGAVQFNTFGTVHEIGTPGTVVTKEDSGKVQGFHIDRVDGIDALLLFNSTASATINTTANHASHEAALLAARFKGAGSFTVAWTPTTATTLGVISGLNSTLTWSYSVDGAGSVAMTVGAHGQWTGTITAAAGAPRTIVVTGS